MPRSTGEIRENSPRSQCPTCHEVFSTAGNFDRHMTPFEKRFMFKRSTNTWERRPGVPICNDPETVGLVISDKTGVWIMPQDWRTSE